MDSSIEAAVAIYGNTAPALVAAVRIARAGLKVALVTPDDNPGGSFPSLGAVETHYKGVRAPLLQEFIDRVITHYRHRYGADSEQFRVCTGGMMIAFEPHVAEAILREWVANEPRILWLPGNTPAEVQRAGTLIQTVTFRAPVRETNCRIVAEAFIDGSDEGDLMALAGAEFRVGREDREEFREPRAGRVFTRWLDGVYPRAAVEGRLNLVTAKATTSDPLPGSSGQGDDNIQSYSYRLCLTDDPANRKMLEAPPPGYTRERYLPILLSPAEKEHVSLPFHHRFLVHTLREMVERDHIFHGHALPNRKRSWNATNLTGGGKRYPTATPAERREIERLHLEHALGLMWFLQNDSAMPADLIKKAREWGLSRDEFMATDLIPPKIYVRESRRLVGRAIFTEHDALLEAGCERAPLHDDAIGITEFSLDSLACTTERLPGMNSLCDGQLFQMEVSRPGQVPYRALLPRGVDNLLVVTTLSTTHVGWGTVRQTPTLMHVAESAAWAIVLAARHGVPPAALDVSVLQRHLVEHGVMISFFNDFDMACQAPWVPAVQFLGARGFFADYNANADGRLDAVTAHAWRQRAPQLDIPHVAGLTRGEAALQAFRQLAPPTLNSGPPRVRAGAGFSK